MNTIYYKENKASQTQTRMRSQCIGCSECMSIKKNKKWRFDCVKYDIQLTFSGYNNYNQYLNHSKGCPVIEINH
jgi:hypothetical protein